MVLFFFYFIFLECMVFSGWIQSFGEIGKRFGRQGVFFFLNLGWDWRADSRCGGSIRLGCGYVNGFGDDLCGRNG